MSTADTPYRPSRGDTAAIWLFIVAGAAIAVFTAIQAVLRTIELLSPGPVRVLAEFIGTPAQAPLGDGGANVSVGLDRATVTVDSLPAVSVLAGVLGQVAYFASTTTVVLCLILLSRHILRGRAFSRASTRLVMTAGLTGLIGSAAVQFFGNMVANGAMARLGDFRGNAVISIQPFPFVLAAFVVAVIATVFTVGARLQRDAEGLV